MRRINKTLALSLVLMLTVVFSVPVYAADDASASDPAEMTNVVKLTDKQKKELASLYRDILKKEQKVIATYVKYGVLTKEQGKMIASHLDKRYMKLEQNGFIPHWGKHMEKHHHMKEHKKHEHHEYHHQEKQREAQ